MVWTTPASGHNIGGGTNFNAILGGNTLYDPGAATGSQQPLGFDQLSQLYSYYRVFASKLSIAVFANTSSATTNIMASIVPYVTNSPLASGYNYIDQPYARYGYAQIYRNPLKISNFMTTKKIWGETDLHDHNYYATTGANPGNLWYWHVNANNIDGSTMDTSSRMICRMVMWCEFSVLVQQAQS